MVSMKTVMVILMTILFSLLFISQSSRAEFYKWLDEKGTVHFTEDPATIPEKYRDKAKSRTTEEDSMTPEQKIRERKRYEDEVRERLMRENKDYDANELERRVKDFVDKAQKQRGECKIVNYTSYDIASGTCVDLVIQNDDREPKTITDQNIIATTSKPISTTWERDIWGRSVPGKKKDKFNPKAVLIQLSPGQSYRGSICFDSKLPIAKLELEGL